MQTGKRTEALDAALLQEEPFLLLKKGNDMHDRAALIFREAGIHPRTALELDQLMTSYALSCRGLGMAFIPDTLIGCDLVGNAVYFRLASPHATRTLAVARKKKRYVNKALEQFILTAAECYK